jgi:lia operon protein LiaF
MTNRKAIFGFILILLGLLLLLRSLDLVFFDFGDLVRIVIPLAIITIGIWMLLRKKHKETLQEQADYDYAKYSQTQVPPSPSGMPGVNPQASETGQAFGAGPGLRTRYNKSFGDMFIDCAGVNMENVEVSCSFGDTEIKVHGGILTNGLNRLIVSGFLGDIRVMVPPDLALMAHVTSTGGDVEVLGRRNSGFGNNLDSQTVNYQTADKKLFIAINTFLGDVKIIQV